MTANVDAGEAPFADHTLIVPMESDGNGSKGDVAKMSSDGQVRDTSSNGDAIVGVLHKDSGSAGDTIGVVVSGPVAVTADGSITQGDLLQPSGSTNGHVVSAASNEGLVTAVDEGGSDTYDIYSKGLMALEDASDGDVMKALLF